MRKPVVWAATATAAVVVTAGTGAVIVVRQAENAGPAQAVASARTGTAKVKRTDLVRVEPVFGTLGFSAPVTVAGIISGSSFTWLPAPGAVVAEGQPLYEVDGRGVPLLAGDRPAWRPLAPGVPAGPDVAQLNTALVRLGYAGGLAGNPRFTVATAAAVRRWQRAIGVTVTGRIELGEVVFAQAPLRVTAVSAKLGGRPEPGGPLLTATSTQRIVTLEVAVDRVYLVHPSDPVTVTLPDGKTTTPGTVSAVSPIATAAQQDNNGPNRGPGMSTVQALVTLADPAVVAAFSTAPVSVNVTTASVQGVLAVPVTALLARPGGGFVVTVLDGDRRREVPVTAGMFADTLVQVSGAGLAEGQTVEVPAS